MSSPEPQVCWNCEKGFHRHCHGMSYRWHLTGRDVNGMPEYVQSQQECGCDCRGDRLW